MRASVIPLAVCNSLGDERGVIFDPTVDDPVCKAGDRPAGDRRSASGVVRRQTLINIGGVGIAPRGVLAIDQVNLTVESCVINRNERRERQRHRVGHIINIRGEEIIPTKVRLRSAPQAGLAQNADFVGMNLQTFD